MNAGERPWRIVTWRDGFGPFETEGQAKAFAVKYLSPKGIKYRVEQEKE